MFRILLCTGVAVLTLGIAETQAQVRDATSKALGQANSFYTGASRQRQAASHAQILNQLGRTYPQVNKEVVAAQSQAIRANSEAALKEFAKVKDANAAHPAIVKQIEAIEKRHEKVLAMCKMLDDCCKEGDADSVKVCDCCATIAKELDAAEKETEHLRESLKIPPLAAPKHDPHAAEKK